MPKEKTHYERQQAKIATAQENVNRILTETIITIPQAIKEIQLVTGIRTNRATLHRWIRHGCNGVKLGVVRIGQRHILTSS
jgi:hypothetical protein